MVKTVALLSLVLIGAMAPARVGAAPPTTGELTRPSTHPAFAVFGFGPAIGISNTITQFKLTQAVGYHLDGTSSGLAAALELQESLGSGVFVLEVGPKLSYDIHIADTLPLYLSPSAMLGFGFASGGGQSAGAFDMQYGIELRMVLSDRGLVFFRPFTIDISIGDGTAVRYDLMFGGGATF